MGKTKDHYVRPERRLFWVFNQCLGRALEEKKGIVLFTVKTTAAGRIVIGEGGDVVYMGARQGPYPGW